MFEDGHPADRKRAAYVATGFCGTSLDVESVAPKAQAEATSTSSGIRCCRIWPRFGAETHEFNADKRGGEDGRCAPPTWLDAKREEKQAAAANLFPLRPKVRLTRRLLERNLSSPTKDRRQSRRFDFESTFDISPRLISLPRLGTE